MHEVEYWAPKGEEPADLTEKGIELWSSGIELIRKIELTIELTKLSPSAIFLSDCWVAFRYSEGFTAEMLAKLLEFYAEGLLQKEDRQLQETLEYSLCTDLFDHQELGAAVWTYLMRKERPEELQRVIARNSGNLDWGIKVAELHRLASHPNTHRAAYEALRSALFWEGGDEHRIDRYEAMELYEKLDVEPFRDEINEPEHYASLGQVEFELQQI